MSDSMDPPLQFVSRKSLAPLLTIVFSILYILDATGKSVVFLDLACISLSEGSSTEGSRTVRSSAS